MSEPGLFTHEKIRRRDLAKGILGSKEVRWKWAVWNGVGAQGEGYDGMRGGAGRDGKRQKWRAKSLRTPFYQYSIYNQKDVLIIVLIILSHPLRSGHYLHLFQD